MSLQATEGNRTLDPPLTKRLLCRLSYGGGYLCGADYTRELILSQGNLS